MPLPAGDLLAGMMKGTAEGLRVLVGRGERKTSTDADTRQGEKPTPEQLAEMRALEEDAKELE